MKGVFDIENMPVACRCSSAKGLADLLKYAKKASNKNDFALMLRHDVLVKRLLPAYLNAVVRFKDGIARTNSMQMEMLILASGEKDIRKAIGKCGADNSKEFLLFATSDNVLKKFLKLSYAKVLKKIKMEFELDAANEVVALNL